MDYSEHFSIIHTIPVIWNNKTPLEHLRLVYTHRILFIVDVRQLNHNITHYWNKHLVSRHTDFFYHDNTPRCAVYPYIDWRDTNFNDPPVINSYNHFLLFNQEQINGETVHFVKIENHNDVICLCYYVNDTIIDKVYNATARSYEVLHFKQIVEMEAMRIVQFSSHININRCTIESTQPTNVVPSKDSLLFEHQQKELKFIKNIEYLVQKDTNLRSFNKGMSVPVLESEFKLIDNKLLRNDTDTHDTIKQHFKFFGGIVSTQMGLGKTITMLSTITPKHNLRQRGICNHYYIRNAKKGTFCNKETDNYFCKQHHKKLPFPIKTRLSSDVLDPPTLVICPKHLCLQWLEECYTKFPDLNVIYITTREHYELTTLSEIYKCDIVILSNALLQKSYFNNGQTNVINDVFWERVVVDECHEIINEHRQNKFIRELNSSYKWLVSGTPYGNFYELCNCLQIITSLNFGDLRYRDTSLYTLLDCGIFSDIYKHVTNLTISHHKRETAREEIKNHQHLLDFGQHERYIYDSYKHHPNSNYLYALCLHPELVSGLKSVMSNCKTFDEIQDVLLKNSIEQRDKLEKKIGSLTRSMNRLKLDETEERQRKQNEINDRSIELQKVTKTLTFLERAVKEKPQNCPICLEEITDLSITHCGHKFCKECITSFLKRFNKCPNCRAHITDATTYNVVQSKPESKPKTPLETTIDNVKSTKVGNVIHFLKDLPETDKAIVFSKYHHLLHLVGGNITNEGLDVLYCEGSVHQRNNAIKKFRENPHYKVLMLSSGNAASGTNLTCANHVVFLEPTDLPTKQQAIARSARIGQHRTVHVHDFLINDTIETPQTSES